MPNRHTGESRYPERLTAPDSGFTAMTGNAAGCRVLKDRRNISYFSPYEDIYMQILFFSRNK